MNEKVDFVLGGSMAASPAWLPILHYYSAIAAQLVSILGLVLVVLRIVKAVKDLWTRK